MVKETLPTWPEKQENPWLRSIKDIFETLKKSRQESKAEKKNEVENINTQLIDHFSEDYGKFFQQKSFCTSLDIEEKLRKGDCLKITRKFSDILYDMYKKMYDYINDEQLTSSKIEFKPDKREKNQWRYTLEEDWVSFVVSTDDLGDFFHHLELWGHSAFFDFSNSIKWQNEIKEIKKFIIRENCCNCYFDLWYFPLWEKISVKDLITRFTKQWKSWNINNCVIKANWKEYHSSWDYRYDFE